MTLAVQRNVKLPTLNFLAHVFVLFYAEFQDGCQESRENDFWQKVVCFSHCFRDKCIFALHAEIQYGHHKKWENDFCHKVAGHSAYTLPSISFVGIALSFSVSKI